MSECSREFFLYNEELEPAAAFEQYFIRPAKYIYEVFRVQEGFPVFIEDHLKRLWHTAELEGVQLSYSPTELLQQIMRVILANSKGDGNIKIIVQQSANNRLATFIFFTPHQYPTADQYQNGVPVSLFFAERHNPNAKVMDVSLRNATDILKAEANVYEVLLVDRQGFITEGSRSNVFFIRSGLLLTPPVETVLEGITRLQLMQLCHENGIAVAEQKVHYSALPQFEALFLSGTSRRVLPINRVDERTFDTSNPLTRRLQQLFEERVKNYLDGFARIRPGRRKSAEQ